MRNIGPEWRNLAEGLLRVETLEASFRSEWGTQLQEAQRKRNEAELRKLGGRGHATLIAACIVALFLFAVALVLLLLSLLPVTVVLVLALVVPAVLALYGVWALLHTQTPLLIARISLAGGGTGSPDALCQYSAPDLHCQRDATMTRATRLSSPTSPASCPRSTSP